MATARLDEERRFHDLQAAARAKTFAREPARLRFRDGDYLDHEPFVREAFGRLGDLHGADALDYGCGHAMAAVVMARAGARVSAFDLSPGYVAEARLRAVANGVHANVQVADAHALPYPDESFDVVWGSAVLHHLELPVALAELRRVMRPGAVGVFCEPWGGGPLARLARRALWYPGKVHTPDEEPLTPADTKLIHATFPEATVEGRQLLGAIRRLRVPALVANLADRLDGALFALVPAARRWGRYAVVTVRGGDASAPPGPG